MNRNNQVKLHLGCGSVYLEGYVNIDKIDGQDSGAGKRKVDLNMDLFELKFQKNSVDEIRLHHVFEHFQRYEVPVLMYQWNNWLKPDGILIIETPNFYRVVRAYIASAWRKDLDDMYQILRHVFGSKEASWANHLEGWDRFTLKDVFELFGFDVEKVQEGKGIRANVKVQGKKKKHLTKNEFKNSTSKFLKRFVINTFEYKVWLNKSLGLLRSLEGNKVTNINIR